jgi:hypothetical protein
VPGWVPVVGDWDGDGRTNIGMFDPATAKWYLRNWNSPGAPDLNPFAFGMPGWVPVAGDWDGNGLTSIGVVDPSSARWYLSSLNRPGPPDYPPFAYGGPGWTPVVGDWDGNGTTTIGTFDPAGRWYLRNQIGPGAPDVAPFAYGAGGWRPVGGDWNFASAPPAPAPQDRGQADPLAPQPPRGGHTDSLALHGREVEQVFLAGLPGPFRAEGPARRGSPISSADGTPPESPVDLRGARGEESLAGGQDLAPAWAARLGSGGSAANAPPEEDVLGGLERDVALRRVKDLDTFFAAWATG